MTIGAYFSVVSINENLDLQIWDTAGNDKFYALAQFNIKNSHLLVLVIDPLTENLDSQLSYLQSLIDGHADLSSTKPNYLLVATKKDVINDKYPQELIQQNLARFQQEFSQLTNNAAPLHVSSKEESTKDLVFNALVTNLPQAEKTEEKIEKQAPTIFARLDAIQKKMQKRSFKPDASRIESIERLKTALHNSASIEETKAALIAEACFLRTPDANGKLRYGINLGSTHFKFFVHFRSYEHSEFYKFIKQELKRIAPEVDLAKTSEFKPVRASNRPSPV